MSVHGSVSVQLCSPRPAVCLHAAGVRTARLPDMTIKLMMASGKQALIIHMRSHKTHLGVHGVRVDDGALDVGQVGVVLQYTGGTGSGT